ncbi:hypothetical protein Aperf_G00000038754 [Anoplocephala perfoliata]
MRIFPDLNSVSLYDVNDHFVAAIVDTKLYLHWFKYNNYTSYALPIDDKSALKPYKKLTCIACHPIEPIVATGNAMGEVMIWWNFTSASTNTFEKSAAIKEGVDDEESSDEGEKDVGNYHFIKMKFVEDCRLLHPKRVKRSGMHWHGFAVTALAFTREGKHLYSGGLEGVLVKWDLTDSFGGFRSRSFLSMLSSPIQAISAPGGAAGDCVVVLLERNSFFVVNGSLQIIYKHSNFDQIPNRWREATVPLPNSSIALALCSSAFPPDSHASMLPSFPVLLPGALGSLQVIDAANGKIISSMDMNQRHYVMCDEVPTPLISEALLMASWCDGEWIATYSELKLPRMASPRPDLAGHNIDNQAQLVWWRRNPTASGSSYDAVFGESLAYLNCEATDLKFTCHPESPQGFHTLLILRDQRVLIWQYNPASEVQQNQRPWKRTGCISLDPKLTFYLTSEEKPSLSASKVVIINYRGDGEIKAMLPRSRDEAAVILKDNGPKSIVICASGLSLKSFAWIRWLSGTTFMEDMLLLHSSNLSTWSELHSNNKSNCMEIIHFELLDPTANTCVALLHSLRSNATCGALCVIEVCPRSCSLTPRTGVFNLAPTGALTVHPFRPLVAVGLADGSCSLYDENLQLLASFAQVPSLPFCDRQRALNSKSKKAERELPSTRPEALVFLPSSQSAPIPPLAVVFSTRRGRDIGRRDLAVYGLPSTSSAKEAIKETPMETVPLQSDQSTSGLLAKVERIDDEGGDTAEHQLLLPVHRRKRHLDTGEELIRTLRQVSQYPLDAAPPPEQLLAQVFKKPSL